MLAQSFLTTLLCIFAVAAHNSPVFLWGVDSPHKPTLQTITTSEFAKMMTPLLKDTMLVAFLERDLSSSDFRCKNKQSDDTCYAHLKDISPKTYYASVEDPVSALNSIANKREFNSVNSLGKLGAPLECAEGKAVFVNFDSVEQERGATLETHDAAISSISRNISCPVVYMYLSTPSDITPSAISRRRVRRQAETTSSKGHVFRDGATFLIYFKQLLLKTLVDGKMQTEEIVPSSMQVTQHNSEGSTSSAKPSFGVTLEGGSKQVVFNITSQGGYYSMGNIAVGDITFRSMNLEAPTDLSFSCGNLTLGAIWKSSTEPNYSVLMWNGLQFQAPFNSKYKADFVFGDAWSCTGFFTPAILSGLFVVAIMLMIVFTGICWMMDINTMDRFDDPKGKTITISAAE